MTRVIRNLFNGDKIPLWQLQVTAARLCSRCLRKFVAFVIFGLPPRIKINELWWRRRCMAAMRACMILQSRIFCNFHSVLKVTKMLCQNCADIPCMCCDMLPFVCLVKRLQSGGQSCECMMNSVAVSNSLDFSLCLLSLWLSCCCLELDLFMY
jgi:hypothetical protein